MVKGNNHANFSPQSKCLIFVHRSLNVLLGGPVSYSSVSELVLWRSGLSENRVFTLRSILFVVWTKNS